jgi:hypothetical protein
MCTIFKKSQENEIYSEQMRKLAMYFSSIDSTDIRENLINFFEKASIFAKDTRNTKKIQLTLEDKKLLKKICDKTDEENLPYIAAFSKYINKIDSIALKDQAIEMVKMIAS